MPKNHIAVPAIAFCATLIVCFAALASARTTKDGAFTVEQAARGQLVYERSCKTCHQADFYRERLQRWDNKSVSELFDAVSTSMPADNVGSLLTSEYIDVLAYVFSITGSPPGNSEITQDNMESILIAKPE